MKKNEVDNNVANSDDNDKCYTVYMHTSPSKKRYIGITSLPAKRRWSNGNGYKSQMFYRAIEKYGWDNFKHEILFEGLTKEDAENKEIELIRFYKTDNCNYGYNVDHGGFSVGRMSDETKNKLSETKSIAVVKYSKSGEFIKKYSCRTDAAKEHNVSGAAITSCCRNILKTVAGFIWRYADEKLTVEHIAWCNTDDSENRKLSVCQYTLSGDFIKEYESAEYAQKIDGYCATSIRQCCKHERRTCNGYIWQYANVELTDDYIAWCNNAEADKRTSVSQYSLSGDFIKMFCGMIDASIETGVSQQSIWSCCNNIYKTAGGYIWRYANTELTKEHIALCNKDTNCICQISLTEGLVRIFDSMRQAEKETGIERHGISRCCKGKQQTAGGYT